MTATTIFVEKFLRKTLQIWLENATYNIDSNILKRGFADAAKPRFSNSPKKYDIPS
jgi:hypothetical protein